MRHEVHAAEVLRVGVRDIWKLFLWYSNIFVFPHVMYLVICIPNCGNFLAVIGFVSIAEHQLHVDQRSIFRTYQTDYVQWGLGRIWDSHMNRIVTFKREAQV